MESANSKYTEKRAVQIELPNTTTLSSDEMLATRGMVLYDRVEQQQSSEAAEKEVEDTKQWEAVAKRRPLKRGLAVTQKAK